LGFKNSLEEKITVHYGTCYLIFFTYYFEFTKIKNYMSILVWVPKNISREVRVCCLESLHFAITQANTGANIEGFNIFNKQNLP